MILIRAYHIIISKIKKKPIRLTSKGKKSGGPITYKRQGDWSCLCYWHHQQTCNYSE